MPASSRASTSAYATLRRFLECDAAPETAMTLEQLHGFFTALISGPELVMPSEYLPAIWGDDDGPEYESLEDAQEVMTAMMQLWNEISGTLMAKRTFTPLLDERRTNTAGVGWADGYVRGVALRHTAWRPALDDTATLDHMTRIIQLSEEGTDNAIRRTLLPQLPEAIAALHAFWLARRTPSGKHRSPAARASPKVGRNDPCLCGSGRKYKYCCGQPTTVH
jgi:uncharacterized protein